MVGTAAGMRILARVKAARPWTEIKAWEGGIISSIARRDAVDEGEGLVAPLFRGVLMYYRQYHLNVLCIYPYRVIEDRGRFTAAAEERTEQNTGVVS